MNYEAELTFKFDSTYTPTYTGGFGSTVDNDFLPEEHYTITAPAADLNARQYFKLFEKFMLCVGMSPHSIREGAMSLVFNDYVNEADQRKVCKEYELTMDEDLRDKFELWKQAEWSHPQSGIHPDNPSDPVHGCPPCPPCDVLQCADHLTDE